MTASICKLCDKPCSYGARWCRDCYVRVVAPLKNMDERTIRANLARAAELARKSEAR